MSRQTDIIELQQISQRCLDIAQELLSNNNFTAITDLPGSIQALKQLACHNKPTPVLASLARVLPVAEKLGGRIKQEWKTKFSENAKYANLYSE